MSLGASVEGFGPNQHLLSATVNRLDEIARSQPADAKQKPLASGSY